MITTEGGKVTKNKTNLSYVRNDETLRVCERIKK